MFELKKKPESVENLIMANRVQVSPPVLQWARERSGQTVEQLSKKFPKYLDWEAGKAAPTIKQLEDLAKKTHTPIGFFFLESPPEDVLPIRDFRTVGGGVKRPSPDLLETIEIMQQRQDWFRDYLEEEGADALPFVGSVTIEDDRNEVALAMREALCCEMGWADKESTWTDALRYLREQIEDCGVMVVINGVVGNNSHRKLSVKEFRGFALSDLFAPLIFINGSDAKAAQMFTLVHEFAHIWIGQDGVSNFQKLQPAQVDVEIFCNAVAAEFLVPAKELLELWNEVERHEDPFGSMARRFKVSSLVAARRALDLKLVDQDEFFDFYEGCKSDEKKRRRRAGIGGNFWNNQNTRIGRRFGYYVVRAVQEGKLLYRDAYHLTGLKSASFDGFAERLRLNL